MPAGRKPKPTALKALAGNPGKRSLNASEPKFGGKAKCPTHLDKIAKAEWRRVASELEANGLLTSVDSAALAGYCSAYSRWATAERMIHATGFTVTSPSGYPMANPCISIANTALTLMHKFASEFGFTPSSRSRLKVETPTTNEDPFTAFMESLGADPGSGTPNAELRGDHATIC